MPALSGICDHMFSSNNIFLKVLSWFLKSICDGKVSPFLKKELLRIYNKEKTWRERLWRSGVVKSSPMSPRKYPEFVGTEEVNSLLCIITSC